MVTAGSLVIPKASPICFLRWEVRQDGSISDSLATLHWFRETGREGIGFWWGAQIKGAEKSIYIWKKNIL